MTNEEALNILHNSSVYHPMYLDALNMAIDSLERSEKFQQKAEVVISQLRADRDRLEDAIAEIRAEINQITDIMGVSYNQYVSKIDVLQIIDKYTAENEE